MEIKIFTWNVQGNLDGQKAKSLLTTLNQKKIDIFVFQEISGDPKIYIPELKKKELKEVYKTHYQKREPADSKEGGYAYIIRKKKFDFNFAKADFDAPIKTDNPLDEDKPDFNRPPLHLDLEILPESRYIRLYTWHAPNEGHKFANGSYSRAYYTLINWKALIQDELQKAEKGELIWILAGDLNVVANSTREIFPGDKYYQRKAGNLDHVIVKYGSPTKVELSAQPLNPRPSGSDHNPLAVKIKID